MTFQQLRCFVSTAKYKSFHEAAVHLFISQPAVSHQIRLLEEELGVKLFDRSQKKASLTQAGKVFYNDALGILNHVDVAMQRVRTVELNEELTVFYDEVADLPQIQEILKRFRKTMPDTIINVTNDYLLTDKNKEGVSSVDVAISCELLFKHRSDIKMSILAESRIYCVMNPEHPLAKCSSLTLDRLNGERFVFQDNTHCPPWLRQQIPLIMKRLPDTRVCYGGNTSQIISLVLADMGITLMPWFMIPKEKGLTTIPVEGTDTIRLAVTSRKGYDQITVATFIRIAKEVFEEMPVAD